MMPCSRKRYESKPTHGHFKGTNQSPANGHRTHRGQGTVDLVVEAEHVPADVAQRRLADAHVEPLEDVRVVVLAVGTADALVQDRGQMAAHPRAGRLVQFGPASSHFPVTHRSD